MAEERYMPTLHKRLHEIRVPAAVKCKRGGEGAIRTGAAILTRAKAPGNTAREQFSGPRFA